MSNLAWLAGGIVACIGFIVLAISAKRLDVGAIRNSMNKFLEYLTLPYFLIGVGVVACVIVLVSGASATIFDAHRLYHLERGHLLLAFALPAALILGARAFQKRQELMLMLGMGVGAYLATAFLIGWLTPDDGGCSPSAHCHLAIGADGSTASVSIPKGMTFCFDGSFWENAARLRMRTSYQNGTEHAFTCSRREVETNTCAESIGDSVRFSPTPGTPPPSYWFVPEKESCGE